MTQSEGRSTEAGEGEQGVTLRAGDVRLQPADGVVCVVPTADLEYLAVVAPDHRYVAQGALVGVTVTAAGNSTYTVVRFSADTTLTGTITGTAAGFQHRVDAGVAVTFNGAITSRD